MSTVKANTYQDASGGNTATINSMTPTADSLQGFRNRIINGAMVIDQRNAGTSISVTANQFVVDRFRCDANLNGIFSAQQRSTAHVTHPAGFTNSVLLTVTTPRTSIAATDVYAIRQQIEGFNTADLGWGSASAKSVTLSFWVRSSITGTYAVSFFNSAFNRSYVATYTISSANTFEYKTVTIAGDTTGTWLTDNGIGVVVLWDLGSGSNYNGTAGSWAATGAIRTSGTTNWISTNGATFYITGVQLEVGSTATPFERRPYGTELMLCQRYYTRIGAGAWGLIYSGANADAGLQFPVTMRSTPSVSHIANYNITLIATAEYTVTNTIINPAASNSVNGLFVRLTSTGMSTGTMCISTGNNIGLNSEL